MNTDNRKIAAQYIDYLTSVRGYSERTAVSYGHDIERLLSFLDSHELSITEMQYEDARLFSRMLYEEGLKPASINRILSCQRSFFRYLNENGICDSMPFSRIVGAKHGRRLPTVLTNQEVLSLLDCPADDYTSLMEVTMFNIFYSTGCRLSEVVTMKVSGLDLDNSRALVLGKGNKERFVFLTERAKSYIREYLVRRDNLVRELGISSDVLLLNKKGRQLPLSTVHIIFDKYRDRLHLTKKFTPHVFRHSFATHLLDNNCDIRIVQMLLGHKSIGTTQIYTHVSSARLDRVYRESHPHSHLEKKEN